MEQAKGAFFADVIGVPLDRAPTVVRKLEVDYTGSIESGQTVGVDLRFDEVGETSFTVAYRITADGDPVATAERVSVLLDGETGDPRSIPREWRDRIAAYGSDEEGADGRA